MSVKSNRHRVVLEFDLDGSGTRTRESVAEEIASHYAADLIEFFGEDPDNPGEGDMGFEGPFVTNAVGRYEGVVK